ncbi:MAG: type II toxin-antitoxin system RelE/ParE family toxin [Cypionkella sp.]
MRDLRLTRAAERDVREIEQFSFTEFGSAATVEYLAGLRETLARLRDFPGMGTPRDDLKPEVRSLRYKSHRIYYRPVPGGILIQRVLHYARQVRREMIDER